MLPFMSQPHGEMFPHDNIISHITRMVVLWLYSCYSNAFLTSKISEYFAIDRLQDSCTYKVLNILKDIEQNVSSNPHIILYPAVYTSIQKHPENVLPNTNYNIYCVTSRDMTAFYDALKLSQLHSVCI
ncbi:hypothetical protein TNIN_169781 [Trichonephila inaurata madagascariensis]|uniref:Uncharacterized protein n=1 Tax=Trichonephila inaurata madagascariensis TaxID=2747483 RepID=A0A8X6YLS7_9ARAC|nr:hypothetical protein TNIN_169781 [Trichonephila inaurata madagascariensis]